MTVHNHILARPCWIFDLDGTLTVPVHDFPAIRIALGMTEADSDILHFLASLPLDEATERHARLIEIEYELAARTTAAPGACKLLEQLLSRAARVGILTRNTREIALHTLGQIGLKDYFISDDILGRHEAAPKPHPEGIEKLLLTWDIPGRDGDGGGLPVRPAGRPRRRYRHHPRRLQQRLPLAGVGRYDSGYFGRAG